MSFFDCLFKKKYTNRNGFQFFPRKKKYRNFLLPIFFLNSNNSHFQKLFWKVEYCSHSTIQMSVLGMWAQYSLLSLISCMQNHWIKSKYFSQLHIIFHIMWLANFTQSNLEHCILWTCSVLQQSSYILISNYTHNFYRKKNLWSMLCKYEIFEFNICFYFFLHKSVIFRINIISSTIPINLLIISFFHWFYMMLWFFFIKVHIVLFN